jgi:nucleotide-binding universal stress UspA family protein
MPKTIVWASDGSESAARALPHATALLDGEGAMLIAVHVVQESFEDKPDSAAADGHAPALVDQVRSLVTDVTERGVKGVLRVVNFPGTQPAQSIANLATEVGADMIVVGTRGHSPVAGVFAGSVAQRLLQVAPCPVLAVPPGAAPPEPQSGSAATPEAVAPGSTAGM